LDINPAEPTINYLLAKALLRVKPINDAAVKRAFGYAVAEPVRGHLPELDFPIYLHESGQITEAEEHFRTLKALDIPYVVKATPRKWVLDEVGNRKSLKALSEALVLLVRI
jgi:hypothetical protein